MELVLLRKGSQSFIGSVFTQFDLPTLCNYNKRKYTGSFPVAFISRRFACIYLIPVPFKKTKTFVQTTMQIAIFSRFSWIRIFVKWKFPEHCTSQWLRRREAVKKFASQMFAVNFELTNKSVFYVFSQRKITP